MDILATIDSRRSTNLILVHTWRMIFGADACIFGVLGSEDLDFVLVMEEVLHLLAHGDRVLI